MIESGLCQCGCGGRTAISPRNSKRNGYVKGQPFKFILGHTSRNSTEFKAEMRPIWFWQKTQVNEAGCIIWMGANNIHGYGHFWTGKRFEMAHRYAYQDKKGPIPEGLDLDHLCRNRLCVNPEHLEPVSRSINLRRGRRTKLTAEDVRYIRASDDSHKNLGEKFGVDPSTICDIRHYRLWAKAE